MGGGYTLDSTRKNKSNLGNDTHAKNQPNNITGVNTTDQSQPDSDPGNQSKNPGQGDTRPPKTKNARP
jgi:hypothetical protein